MADETADPFTSFFSDAASKIESARAKINLALHVLHRRPDGYHNLDSLVVFAEIADTLTAFGRDERRDRARRRRATSPKSLPKPPGRRTISSLPSPMRWCGPSRRAGPAACGSTSTKELPVAAGLGGGSADAAATLRLLNRLWRLGLALPELAELGATLGADVPACLVSRPARIEGIGERVTPVPGIPALPLVLVNPGVALSTESVFGWLRPADRTPLPPLPSRFGSVMELVFWLRKTRNDLFEPAAAKAPAIETAVRLLASDPDCMFARMSGSGATVFGIFFSPEAAVRSAERLREARPDWWIAVTGTGGS